MALRPVTACHRARHFLLLDACKLLRILRVTAAPHCRLRPARLSNRLRFHVLTSPVPHAGARTAHKGRAEPNSQPATHIL